ncbi:hypothetical protein [Pseudomonas sp. PS01301]|nr:hypothetical protein [Pseudomonas sp. PS01301]
MRAMWQLTGSLNLRPVPPLRCGESKPPENKELFIMGLKRLLPLSACLALMLPFAAQAAALSADAKAEYTAQCQAAAVQQGVDAAKAQAHCSCGAKVIEDKFTQAEIDQLTNKQVEPPMALRQKLMKEVLVCKNQ